nr:TPA: hypothetical protein [Oryctes rhinoceros nudivirus]
MNNRQQAFDPQFAYTTTPIPLFSSGASPSNLDGQFCNAQTCGMLLSVNACKFKMFAVFIITLVFIVILVCIIVLYSNHRRYKSIYVRSERDAPPPSHNGENSDAGSVYSDVLARLPQFRKFYDNHDRSTTSNDDGAYIVEPVVPRIHKNVNLLPFDSIDRDDDYYAELEQDDAKMGHKTDNIADSVASGSINGDENDNDYDDEDVEMSDDEPLSNKTTTATTTNASVDKRVAGRSSISNPQTTTTTNTTISNATTSANTTTQTSTNKPGIYPSLDKVTA